MQKLKLLDLFSGIGGFSLGLERSGGFETVAFCEIEEFPRRVLAKHWPEVPCYYEIRDLTAERLAADGITVDAICGGFPCQDISTAGRGAGIEGERSGLWREYARLIGELRPRVVFVENVAALLGRGMDVVCGDLAALGYNAEWDVISAADIGARHKRARLWLVAHPDSERKLQSERLFAYVWRWIGDGGQAANVADSLRVRPSGSGRPVNARNSAQEEDREKHRAFYDCGWAVEPAVGRMAHGVPNGVDRLKALGNAVVPQIPELLGRAWLAAQEQAA
jgi:DNA (cytosine-5)-methyltransferase 1